ncbi:unnamed protein product [Mytilus edulis]|uniref:TIR domain-containing protein n=1 Tax=Mytilus edulis TaxID=6550 RepID=A0A8S3Q9I8_MYTED|nr:unnamed protein product [Mytilus edulis]
MENSKEEVVVITNVEQAVLPMLEDEDVHTNKSPTSTSKASTSTSKAPTSTSKASTSTSTAPTSTSKAPTSTSKAPTSTSQTQTQWNQRYEKFLLDTYKTFEESKNQSKINGELLLILLKIKCLKEKFDRHQKKLNKSGEEHTEMPPELEIFESQPDVKPVITMDSFKCDKGKRQHEDNGIDVSSEEEEDRSIKPDPKKAKLCPTPNVGVFLKCQNNIRNAVYLYHLRRRRQRRSVRSDLPETYEFDVYVVYCADDRKWVHEVLLKRLEDEGLKVCIHFRDFELGEGIVENIERFMNKSWKIVVIMSNNFAKSEWCQWEVNLVQERRRRRGKNAMVLIMMKQINSKHMTSSIRTLLFTTPYLSYTKRLGKRLFWTAVISGVNKSYDDPPVAVSYIA